MSAPQDADRERRIRMLQRRTILRFAAVGLVVGVAASYAADWIVGWAL